MVDRLGDLFPDEVNGQVTAPQALNVFTPILLDHATEKSDRLGEFLIHLECLHCRTRLVQDGRKSNCC